MSTPDGHPALFEYPGRAAVGRVVPKNRLYVAGRATRRMRDQITAKVAKIIWQYKLAPETLNIPASPAVQEVQVFSLALKPPGIEDGLPEDVLRCIDRAIGFPIIFELAANRDDGAADNQIRVAASYKRPSEADGAKWVISDYFATDWLPANTPRSPLPVALDMVRLYEQMLRPLIPAQSRRGESLPDLIERQSRVAVKTREGRRLEARVQREKQFNRKVELNRRLRQLKTDLEALTR